MQSGELRLVYTVAEAAELLGIGRSTAYELVGRCELPTTRLGSRVVVTRPTLTRLLGMEPPLPGELESARRAVADSSKPASVGVTRGLRETATEQARLPFTG